MRAVLEGRLVSGYPYDVGRVCPFAMMTSIAFHLVGRAHQRVLLTARAAPDAFGKKLLTLRPLALAAALGD